MKHVDSTPPAGNMPSRYFVRAPPSVILIDVLILQALGQWAFGNVLDNVSRQRTRYRQQNGTCAFRSSQLWTAGGAVVRSGGAVRGSTAIASTTARTEFRAGLGPYFRVRSMAACCTPFVALLQCAPGSVFSERVPPTDCYSLRTTEWVGRARGFVSHTGGSKNTSHDQRVNNTKD